MVLVMELILPVILLSLVTVMRLGSLPSKNQECHYQKWSMPSAGVIPFLQSYVCNIDNYCFNDVDSLKSVEVSAKSFSALTQDVLPLISSDDTLQILTVSNKSSGLLNLFKNVIEDKQLLFDIGEQLYIKYYIRNETEFKNILVNKYQILTLDEVNEIMMSKLNIAKLLNMTEITDIKTVVCNDEQFQSFIIFPESSRAQNISTVLCELYLLNGTELINEVFQNVNFSSVIRAIKLIEEIKDKGPLKTNLTFILDELAKMYDIVRNEEAFLRAVQVLFDLPNVNDLLNIVPFLVENRNDLKDLIEFTRKLVHSLNPIMFSLKMDNSILWIMLQNMALLGDYWQEISDGTWSHSTADFVKPLVVIVNNINQLLVDNTSTIGINLIKLLADSNWISFTNELSTFIRALTVSNGSTINSLIQLVDFGPDLTKALNQVIMNGNYTELELLLTKAFLSLNLQDSIGNLLLTSFRNLILAVQSSESFTLFIQQLKSVLQITSFSLSTMCNIEDLFISQTDQTVKQALYLIIESLSALSNMFKILPELDDLSCTLFNKTGLHVIGFLNKLTDIGFWNDLQKSVADFSNPTLSLNCLSPVEAVTVITESIDNTFTKDGLNITRVIQCFSPSEGQIVNMLTSISNYLVLLNDLVNILQKPAVETFVTDPDIIPLFDLMLDIVLYSSKENVDVRPVMLHVSNLLRSDRNITEFLLNLGLSQLMVDTFLTAAVYTNQTFFLQQSILDITNILCNPLKLVKVMTLSVTAQVSLINISSSFCSSTPQGVVIAEYLKDSSLSSAVINSLITSSPSNLIDTINSVLPVVRDLFSEYFDVIKFFITSIIETNIIVFQDSYSVVDQLLQNNTMTALSNELQLLMTKLVPVFPPKFTSVTVMSSIQTIFNGLIDADILKGYLLPEIQVKSMLKYPMNTTNYFTSVLGITENVAQEILNAVFSSGILQGLANYSSYTCNEVLKRLVFVNATKATLQNVQTEICALNTSQVVKLLNVLIPELDISALISKYVSYISATMLQQTNVTSKELEGLASTVNKGVSSFVETYQQLNQSQSKMDIVQLFLASSKSSMTSFDKISHSLCGKKLSGVSLLTSLGTNLPIVKTLVNSIQTEFAGLNNDISGACQDLFKTISDLELGNVLWNYLKPVLLGKILYTPDNELTRTILSKANKTFALVGELNRIAKAWADQAGNLQVLLDFIKDSSPFKDALNNEAIQDILRATTGIEPELLLTSLSTLENTTFSNDILETLQSVAATVANYTSCILADRFQPVSNETEMENMAFQLSKSKTFFAGIVFYDVDESNNATRQKSQASKYTIPKHIGYKIRMEVDSVMDTNLLKERIFTMSSESSFIEKLLYLRGFIFLQDLLDSEIIELHKNQSFSSPAINLIQMPFPCHRADGFQYFLGTYCVPTILCFVFLSLLAVATFNLVSDKENGQTEALCVMGMLKGVHFLAWFLSTMFMMLTVAIIMAVMLKYTNIFINSNLFIMFLLMACFSLCSTMMIYMVAAFFTQTSMSFLFATVLYFLLFLPFTLFVSLEYQLTSWQLILASLCATSSFGFGIFKISILEEQNIGIQWSNINVSLNEQPSFAWSMYFLLIDSVIFFLVGWYVQEIKPGHYGLGEKFYFPFQLTYWKRFFKYKLPTREMTGRMTHTESNWYEAMPADVKVGISVENISKVYNNKKVLDQLDLQFYENQITSLLGHNGAAKTTTIKIICGLLKPTSGHVSFSNNSLLGLCPQQNSFFNYMTVKENMRFYAGVKNNRSKNKKIISLEIYRLLKEVDLWQNRNIPARNLSYGMKRRLCVALAFVGGSTSIILDEPTSGIDPHTRKHIWNLLTKNRTGRTIVLSTHHLDEADFLSDRIGVMHQGKLICCGSPTFLKQSVGGGYRLTIMKADQTSLRQDQPQEIIDLRSKSSTAAITMFIQSLCSNATLEEQAGSDLIFNLPKDHSLIVPIDEFFRRLDQSVNQLNIGSYGLSDTSLEEIFLKLTKSADQDLSNNTQATKTKVPNQQSSRVDFDDGQLRTGSLDPLCDMNYRRTGMKLKLVHIEALILKRLHHYRRNWRMLVFSIFLPMSFVLLSLIFNSFRPDDLDPKPLLLDPSIYGSGINSFYQDAVKSDMTNKLVHELADNNIGYGAACMKDWQQKYFKTDKCVSKSPWYNNSLPMYKVECVDSLQTFTSQSTNYLIPEKHVQADNFIQNLNDWSIPYFLINTFEMYKQNRFGGWSFESLDKNDSLDTYVWFNTKGYHSMPSYYNALTNTILRAQLPDGRNSSEYGITAVNHPIRLSGIQLNFKSLISYTTDLEVSLLMLVAFTFVPCGCVLFVITEKTMKERQLQSISGMTSITYWTVTFIWDMFMYCCTICLGVIWIVLVKPDSFYLKDNLAAFFVAILLYGWCMIPLVYSVSRLFNNGGKAYFSIFISSVLLATITLVSFLTITFFSYMTTGYKVLKYLLLIVPQFSIGQGLTDMATNTALYNIFKRYNEDRFVSPFSTEILGWNLLAMALEGVIFFVLNLLLDGVRQPVLSLDQESSLLEQTLSEDEDVIREKGRIQQGLGNDLLIVDNLSKVYKKNGRKFFAVNHISFGVPEGQCFGLLGVNGAGKTTTFRMLTGDCLPSCGTVILKGERLSKKDTHFGQNVGYCPQEGGLDEYLTAEEMLYFHARLRGLHPWQTKILVNELLVELGLTQYAHKAVHTYSGGTKRKLALGVALLGHPPIVYLDEPTTGMDAATRRLAWKCIEKATRNGQSVILTSHSMDECDTLCSTLAIMVDGEIKCIGSPQHLKHKFGDGYIVTIHKGNKLLTDICHDFVNRFTGSEVIGKHHSCVKLQVPFTSFSLANILTYLQAAQEVQSISFYSVTQTTLDSVFIKFAHEQSTGYANNISDKHEASKSSSQPSSSNSGSTFSKEVSTSVSNSDLENLSGFKNPAFLGHISTKLESSPADTNSRRRYVSIIPIKPQK